MAKKRTDVLYLYLADANRIYQIIGRDRISRFAFDNQSVIVDPPLAIKSKAGP